MKAPLAQSLNLCLLIKFWNPPFIPLGSTKMRKCFYIEYRDSLVRELPISGNKNRISVFPPLGYLKSRVRFCFLKAEGAKPPTKQALN